MQTRIYKRKQKRPHPPELYVADSEFEPTRSKVEEDKITETLSEIDNTLEENAS